MKNFYSFILVLFICSSSFAQKNGIVRGIAYDTISKQPVSGATVTLMVRKDSSLQSFTMTGRDGQFELKGIPNGEYRLMISHVNYYNTNKYFRITDSSKVFEAGNLVLNDKTKVLEEVVIAAEAPPVTLVNDTIQYNAGSFKVQPNASVEQLLKKLPGVKVEKDGSIKAQGEKVTRVLVDGKEFFGNDPKIATRNLPADAVDKVQVYDKQSDQAQLTGFDDGNYEKTINLKLKKDKKKGVFGKISGGAGNQDRFENKFNVNSFKGARQVSAIGMGNNTNAEGFSFMDILNFTGELARMKKSLDGGGGVNISIDDKDAAAFGSNGGNSGIKTAWGGGLNYNNIIGKTLDWQSNYFYNRLNPKQENHISRQYLLPDSTYFYDENSFSDNLNNNHRLNINTLWQVDSLNSIRINPSFSYQKMDNRSETNYQTLSEERTLTNRGFSNSNSSNSGYNFRTDLIWRKKFAKRGRTFSLSLQSTFNNSNGQGNLYSINDFFQPNGTVLRTDTLNQHNNSMANLKGYNARAVYTEPFWKKSLLELSVTKSDTRNNAEKLTYDFNKGNGKFDQLNNLLSNTFQNTYAFTNTGFRWRTQHRKYSYAFGMSWQEAQMEGKIISGTHDSLISKNFHDLLPNARFQYNISKFKNFGITYSTSTNQPTAQQLQPVPDNSNSLNIREGNPYLKQEYVQSLMTHLQLLNPYKNKSLFFFASGQFTRNKIANYDSIDQFGVKRTRPVNVNGVYNLNGNISYNMPLKFLKGSVEISSNTGWLRNKQFIQGEENTIQTFFFGPGVRFDINPTEKINLGVEYNLNYNKTSYSLQSALNNNYLSQDYDASADIQLPKLFFLSTDFSYTVNSQRANGFNFSIPLWNASLSKQFLKYKRGELKLSARDLLNRNVGISRNTNNNYIEDARVLTLRRFFLLSFTYSLSKTGLNKTDGGNIRIISR
jgi:hypothetical protein